MRKAIIADTLKKLVSPEFTKRYKEDLENILGERIDIVGEVRQMDRGPVLFLTSPRIISKSSLVNASFREIFITAFSDYDTKKDDLLVTIRFYLSGTCWTDKEVTIPIGYVVYEKSSGNYKFTSTKNAEPDMVRR